MYSKVSNKRAGGNKAVQIIIFQNSSVKMIKNGKFQKIDKRAGGNKAVHIGKFQKINNLCSTFIIYSRVQGSFFLEVCFLCS